MGGFWIGVVGSIGGYGRWGDPGVSRSGGVQGLGSGGRDLGVVGVGRWWGSRGGWVGRWWGSRE